ncbi:hypothetical protein QBC46DRAFT_379707 [Diplogelasinospora grovesii]|uniref:Uncharacterized protein n=1 Tax=Diplogelasinospora grovesii TaxID=303347 RepID=A0AAN6S6P4_9PEZI|nr:hypothetical protein QBC46DRAFT_379707 [Diplogelasinospora grovesii]
MPPPALWQPAPSASLSLIWANYLLYTSTRFFVRASVLMLYSRIFWASAHHLIYTGLPRHCCCYGNGVRCLVNCAADTVPPAAPLTGLSPPPGRTGHWDACRRWAEESERP